MLLNRGSDTMINVAQAWAEEYARVEPRVSVEVAGGGSGVGIAALIDGTVQIANSSRPMKAAERAAARASRGVDPVQHITGYDALVVYVHASNPVRSMTLGQLRELFAEGGRITRWSDLGVHHAACPRDTIVRISRQSSSGTYDFFREVALDTHDFKLGTLELNGSKEVVELVAHTPCAIGYSGMGYATARRAHAVPGQGRWRAGPADTRGDTRPELPDRAAALHVHGRRARGRDEAVSRLDPLARRTAARGGRRLRAAPRRGHGAPARRPERP